jgi:hypothetical protein
MKTLLQTLFFFLLVTQICFGQWVQTSGPNGGKVQCLAVIESTLFAATSDSGIYRSTNNGGDWDRLVTGLQNSYVNCFASIGTNVFAGTMSQGVVRSTNNGNNWTLVNNGLTDTVVWSLDNLGTNLYAGTDSGVFLSTNNGTNWMQTGLDTVIVWAFATSDENIFAGTNGGVFLSTNNGTSWTRVDTGWTWAMSAEMSTLTLSGYNLFGIHRHPGYWFCPSCSERIRSSVTAGAAPMPTFVHPTEVMTGPPPALYLSTDYGTSWTDIAFVCMPLNALAVSGTNIFAGLSDDGSWQQYGVLLSTNNGTSWAMVNTGFASWANVYSLAVKDTYLFAGTDSAGVWRRPISEMITSVREFPTNELPSNFSLEQNYPNPFNPSTTISYQIPTRIMVTLKLYDILGREVTTLVSEEKPAGTYELTWNAENLPSGVYFYQLTAGEFIQTRKMILLK